jgi:polysaccharide pyruvyl transferase WcaK-like protein
MDEAGALGLKECVLVSHDHSDQQMVTAIRERSRPGHRLRCLPQILTRADIPEVYGRAALVLSNRLHALLLGLQYGAVALALVRASSQPKITGQLADIGLGDHIIDTETSSPPPGIVRFTVDRHREINRVVDAYRDKALTTGRLAFASLFP